MKSMLGKPGSKSGFILRLSQCLFAAASMTTMVSGIGFSSYTSFCYLVASMGLQMLWSFGVAILDIYALLAKRDLNNPILMSLFVVGDWVTATLSLSAACSSAGVIVLFSKDLGICRSPCDRFQLSVALALITWFLIFISSLVILWILPSVH